MDDKFIKLEIPLHTHFNTPDINMRIFSKDTFMKCINGDYAKEMKSLYGGIPITKTRSEESSTLTDLASFASFTPDELIGIINDIDIDDNVAKCTINENAKELLEGIIPSLGVRALGTVTKMDKGSRCDITKIISFDLIDATNNPCE